MREKEKLLSFENILIVVINTVKIYHLNLLKRTVFLAACGPPAGGQGPLFAAVGGRSGV